MDEKNNRVTEWSDRTLTIQYIRRRRSSSLVTRRFYSSNFSSEGVGDKIAKYLRKLFEKKIMYSFFLDLSFIIFINLYYLNFINHLILLLVKKRQ